MVEGVNILANAVKSTLGPKGRNVVLERSFGAPTVTKDGVSVAKEIELKDKLENMGAQLVKEVASKTNDIAGDGTTTATVLAQAIVREGTEVCGRWPEPHGPEARHRQGCGCLGGRAAEGFQSQHHQQRNRPGRLHLCQLGDESIGKIIAEAMDKVGKEGVITVEEGKRLENELRRGRRHAV